MLVSYHKRIYLLLNSVDLTQIQVHSAAYHMTPSSGVVWWRKSREWCHKQMDMDCCWQSCLLQQLQGYVWVTIHRYHHAATRIAGQSAYRETVQGGHWDCVPLGESIRPSRDDHTPRTQRICHTRGVNGVRHKGRTADLLHILWGMAEDITGCNTCDIMGCNTCDWYHCLLHGISQSALPSILHQGFCAWYERRTHRECTGVYDETW